MGKDAAITVRIPAVLKRKLEAKAQRERRSLSAQIATYLERSVELEPETDKRASGRFLGRYTGTPVPTDDDFAEARRLLWGSLGKK